MPERESLRGELRTTLNKEEVISQLEQLLQSDTYSESVQQEVRQLISFVIHKDRKPDFPNKHDNQKRLLISAQIYLEAINKKITALRQMLVREGAGDSELSQYLRNVHPFFQ